MNPHQGGCGAASVKIICLGRGTGSAALLIGILGGHPPHGKGTGGFSGPGSETSDGTATAENTGQDVNIHFVSNGKGGGRVLDNGEIHQAAQEHSHTVHCYAITVRPV